MPRIYDPENTPEQNLEILAANPYPGRFLAVGFDLGGYAVQIYAIGGRSEGSQNRVLVEEAGIVSTEIYDTSKPVGDPTLTIYDATRHRKKLHLVSNGDQTDTALKYLRAGKTFQEAMDSRTYEPDVPNYTPRISGFINTAASEEEPALGISIIRKVAVSDLAVRDFFTDLSGELLKKEGLANAVHTYKGDGDPLPAYDEPSFVIPVHHETLKETAEMVWDHLNPDTRVGVAVQVTDDLAGTLTHIINRHKI
jgi:IMP cyclohydrolase